MCEVCGFVWCVPACPRYVEENDPRQTGRCACCGAVLFEAERTVCAACETADNEENE